MANSWRQKPPSFHARILVPGYEVRVAGEGTITPVDLTQEETASLPMWRVTEYMVCVCVAVCKSRHDPAIRLLWVERDEGGNTKHWGLDVLTRSVLTRSQIMPRASEFHYCSDESSKVSVIISVISRAKRVGLLL